jgi:DNA-binding transcriptional ArsR family regulator
MAQARKAKAKQAKFPGESLEEMREHACDAAQLMKALAHESRLLVLCTLSEGEMSVGQLNERVDLSQSALSQHLSVLRRDGLVTTRRESQTIYYSLADGPACKVIDVLHGIYCG